jgi:hypothetical protein
MATEEQKQAVVDAKAHVALAVQGMVKNGIDRASFSDGANQWTMLLIERSGALQFTVLVEGIITGDEPT